MIATLSAAMTVALIAAPPQMPSAVVSTPAGTQPVQMSLAWMPGVVQCDGMAVAATAMRRPLTGLSWQGQSEAPRSATYRFRIDASGRPLSIARDGSGYVIQAEDIAPSLAASRFSAGAARGDCAITYTARLSPMATAPVADLIAYSITPTMGALPRAGWERIRPAATGCGIYPRPQALMRAFPDFRALPATPGVRNWSMVGYDLDARGRPVRVRTVEGTRNAALDTAAVKAVAASRFTPGARAGCLYPYRRNPGTIAAPPLPNRIGALATSDHCPAGEWTYRPTPNYPSAWHRRAIEGWAVVAFDVAPWGDIGNVRVVASEPAADFGTAAMQLLRGARKPVSTTGHSGCIERVRFVMRAGTATPVDPVSVDD